MYLNSLHYPPRLLLVLPELAPSATIYIIKPLTQLASQGEIIFEWILEANASIPVIKSSDLVLFCRNRDPAYNWILEECAANQIPTIYDLDDNFWQVPLDLPYAMLFRAPERLAQLEKYLAGADLVRVYSPFLQGIVSKYSHNICHATPCIDMRLAPANQIPRKDEKVRITYLTGRGRSDELLQLFEEALVKVLERYPDLVEMHWWGEIPPAFRNHPSSHMHEIIHEYDTFLYQLSRQGFDIGLAPLTPTAFNLSKTNTKFRDYGASRIAGVYSNVEVYANSVTHEQTGLLVEQSSDVWFEAIARLVEDKKLRGHIQEAAYRYVKQNYHQDRSLKQWNELLTQILSAHPADTLENRSYPNKFPEREGNAHSHRLFLGAPAGAPQGFTKISGQPGPGVSVIADLNAPLPFAANSAGLILVHNASEEITNPDELMAEIHRVAVAGAQAVLQASYSWPEYGGQPAASQIHFNEETPKRWAAEIDLRCLRTEFFYRPPYLNHRQDQKRLLRRERAGVCDLILYHFIVVKDGLPKVERAQLAEEMILYEPDIIAARRIKDANEALKMETEQLRYESKTWRTTIAQKDAELAETVAGLAEIEAELAVLEAKLETSTAKIKATEDTLGAAQTEFLFREEQFNQKLSATTEQHARQMYFARMAAQQVDALRSRTVVRLAERLFGKADDSRDLPPSLVRLLDDSFIFNQSLSGFRLLPSLNLQTVPRLSYAIGFSQANNMTEYLCALLIAPVIDLLPSSGEIGLEVVTQTGGIVVQAALPATNIEPGKPLHIDFPAIPIKEGNTLELHIYAHKLDVPVRIYEWRKYPLFRLGRVQIRPFLGFDFDKKNG